LPGIATNGTTEFIDALLTSENEAAPRKPSRHSAVFAARAEFTAESDALIEAAVNH
jgi:hypothetical protein